MGNRLKQEKSPYLLQHGENPVDWYPWCSEAFEKARKEEKPVFLSIGYSTCHWCHVMAHESFEDAEVAALLNRDYVSIKVDREERPDVDAVYMSVCQAMTGSGGWPLTILMTPDQKPFFAGTYLPKRGAYGRYGLIELLKRVSELWKTERSDLLAMGNQITAAIQRPSGHSAREPSKELVENAYRQLQSSFDHQWGGFGQAPKFPTPHNLLFLMRYDTPEAMDMVKVTLDAMERGGIHDQIGGGFSRYSTDERWLVPHFEKMLYDNALLLWAYVTAYQHTRQERYADVAHRTARYILRELRSEEGGCYCGQDADSEGVEGKYYVFTPEEVRSVLGEQDGKAFCRAYGITAEGNFEGASIPNRIGQEKAAWDRDDARLAKLYAYRLERTKLHKDDMILLSWNAWTMLALAKAGQVLGEQAYLDAAVGIHRFVETKMTDTYDRLYLRYRDGDAAHAAQLEDYAVYALALLELYRVTFEVPYLEKAVRRARQMVEHFEDKQHGGYFMTAHDGEALLTRPKETYDGAIPSGNSVAALVLQKLEALTGDVQWQVAAQRQLWFLAGEISDYPAASTLCVMAVMDALYPHRELVCVTKAEIPEDLQRFLQENPAGDLHVLLKTEQNAKALAVCAPFTQAYPIPDRGALYYLCENGSCKAPAEDFLALKL